MPHYRLNMNDSVAIIVPVHEGKLFPSMAQKKIISSALRKREGQEVRLTIGQRTKERSNAQNRYMWGVVYTMIAAETGHSTEEIHEFMKSMLLPRCFVKISTKEQEITKSTSTLSTYEMEEYLEKVRAFAASELNLQIPLPHEIS